MNTENRRLHFRGRKTSKEELRLLQGELLSDQELLELAVQPPVEHQRALYNVFGDHISRQLRNSSAFDKADEKSEQLESTGFANGEA